MRQALEPWRLRHGFELEWVEISGDDALESRYGPCIPVLEDASSGRELCHYHLDVEALRRWLAEAGRDD
ncbi:MAG: glutaredoxin family protein [Gammaproteobacteria bacterium]|nr:MAG: glutaredoxin family protein [Gammaproteobacteria bacterium]